MKYLYISVLCGLALVICFAFGAELGLKNAKVEAIEVPTIVKETEVVTVNQTVFVDKLEDWESVEELESFLNSDNTDEIGYGYFNCIDYCLKLRDRAAQVGKNLEINLITYDEYLKYSKYFGVPEKEFEYHAIIMALVEGKYYYIEPQSDIYCKA